MLCPHCRQNIPEDADLCPDCGRPVSSRPEVVEPELLDENGRPVFPRSPGADRQNSRQQSYTKVFYTTFPGGGGKNDGLPPSCLPTLITLGLTLGAAFTFGLLAGIGFFVFAAIGRAATFVLTIRHLLEGRFVNPWLFHIGTWVICWLLVAWLSGDMG